jgi:hypothetical protein
VTHTIEIALVEWREIPPLLSFLHARHIEARIAPPPERAIVVEPAQDDPAAIEVFVALHTWVDGGGSELNLRIDGQHYVVRTAPDAAAI